MIPFLKSLGAAVGFLIAEFVISALYLINCDGYMTLKDLLRISWKKIIAGAVMTFVILRQASFMEATTLHIIAIVALGITVYMVCLLILRDRMLLTALQALPAKAKRFLAKRK